MQRVSGFTLLEIMVATAILSFSLISIMSSQGNSLLTSHRAEQVTEATMLAKQKMTEIEIELGKGMRKGEFPDEKSEEDSFPKPHEEYRWHYDLKHVQLPAPTAADEGSIQGMIGKQLTEEIGKSVRELKLTVSWGEGKQQESVELVTHVVNL